jgi:uncharacterized protein YbjT (DUF2867 family)
MKKAVLFGASGFIGSSLLEELLKSPDYDRVTVVVRKKLKTEHLKLKTLIGDLQSLPSIKDQIQGDDIFIALGTTKKKIPQQDEYYKVDHDYPVLTAKIAKENGAKSIFLVTAAGANARSNFFYVRTKGEVERDILALNYEHSHLFRPSMLLGHREENRPMEKLFIHLWSAIDPIFVGPLSLYRGIDGKDVAKAMVRAAQQSSEGVKIYHWKEMQAYPKIFLEKTPRVVG